MKHVRNYLVAYYENIRKKLENEKMTVAMRDEYISKALEVNLAINILDGYLDNLGNPKK